MRRPTAYLLAGHVMRRSTDMIRAAWMATGLAAAVATGVVLGSTGSGSAAVGCPPTTFSTAVFTNPQANPYYPLKPGLVLRYRGRDGAERFRERVAVTHHTKMVDGVRARVIHDVLRRADGTVAEATHDWYAADNRGNVWYLGEATATYSRDGRVTGREGSWQAGVNGAVPGLIMPADPRPTDAYRQEYWGGHAEDQAWIVQHRTSVTVPLGTYHRVVRSYEWSRLEKANVSVKFYARGLGIVMERDVAGGSEIFKLVGVTR
jgi:hypothetical protein